MDNFLESTLFFFKSYKPILLSYLPIPPKKIVYILVYQMLGICDSILC
jgi:hypothetical protein